MDKANPKTALTKTDLARLLNGNSERWPELVPMWEKYMEKCSRARRIQVSQFGFWLRTKHPKLFNKIYKQAAKHPELLKEIYTDSSAG